MFVAPAEAGAQNSLVISGNLWIPASRRRATGNDGWAQGAMTMGSPEISGAPPVKFSSITVPALKLATYICVMASI
jgi:hypothetical protein